MRSRIARAIAVSVCTLLVAAVVSVSPALAAAPEAPVAEAQSHTATGVFLHGLLNPGVEPAQEGTYEFLYAASPTLCTGESKGKRGLSFGLPEEPVGEEIGGLSSHTTYTVCLRDRNLLGEEAISAPVTFTTSFEPEASETGVVESISTTGATLTGTLNPNSKRDEPLPAEPGFYEFIYKRSASECEGEGSTGKLSETLVAGKLEPLQGKEKEAVQTEISGLAPGVQYTVCLRAWNATEQSATGAPVTFTTYPEGPTVGEEKASNVVTRSADVSAQVTTGGLPVTYTVQYGKTGVYGQETASIKTGPEVTTISAALTGLEPGIEYHYRFVVSNAQGEQAGADATLTTTGLPETALSGSGACPNERLRVENSSTRLPDCRAYEMMSPSYKEGYQVFVANGATDGNRAILISLANLNAPGGGESIFRGALYQDTRTKFGWQLAPLNAPSSRFVGQVPVGVEPINGLTLWEQHTPAEPLTRQGMYVRSSGAEPTYSLIGPLNIPFAGEPQEPSSSMYLFIYHTTSSVAATEDYKHIIVKGGVSEDHWPFDATVSNKESLYEYSGTANSQPILVGVNGAEKGSTELIGQCGVELGSGFGGSTYNALSRDGSTVFFTVDPESAVTQCNHIAPDTAEVYARIHGALSDPSTASTVNISASECTVGGHECEDQSSKNFEGASEDGRRAFFTSTQKLTNDAVDGTASGEEAATTGSGCAGIEAGTGGCNLYEYNFDSVPHLGLIAAGEVSGLVEIGEDASYVYFVSRNAIGSASANEFGTSPVSGGFNLYAYNTATKAMAFIATLSGNDSRDWFKLFSRRTAEVGGEHGQYLVFESTQSRVTPDDTASIRQLFEYDADTGELVRLTKGEGGYNEDGNSVRVGVPLSITKKFGGQLGGTDFKSRADRSHISADGRTVVFETGGRLSPLATSAESESLEEGPCLSVYEYHSAGAIAEGGVHLISDGHDTQLNSETCGAEVQAISPSGSDIMFATFDPLVPGDVDGGQLDVYDARLNGGFPASPAAPDCQGEGCLGSPGSVASLAVPASVSFTGADNLAPVPASSRRVKSLSRAQRRAQALQRCRRLPNKRKRRACERSAHRRYGLSAGTADRANGRAK